MTTTAHFVGIMRRALTAASFRGRVVIFKEMDEVQRETHHNQASVYANGIEIGKRF